MMQERLGRSEGSQNLTKLLLTSEPLCPAVKRLGVPDTKIHQAFARAAAVQQNLQWVSSDYPQIEVKAAR